MMKRPREASGPGYRPAEEPVEGAVFWQLVSGRPDSTEVAVGRTTLVDTVFMGYGRPRGDATTCPVDESMTSHPTVIEPAMRVAVVVDGLYNVQLKSNANAL